VPSAELQQNGTIRADHKARQQAGAHGTSGMFTRGQENVAFYLRKFYQRIPRRRGGGKPSLDLARKFLGVIYHTLKNKWVFEDFPNFVLAS
jgi:hypothetical protein